MKFTVAICTIILATSVSAVAVADPFCHRIGEPCSKVKRAAEAVAEAFAEPKADANADANTVATSVWAALRDRFFSTGASSVASSA